MNLAVLLMSCTGEPRVSALTRDWIDDAMAQVALFYRLQSGGRRDLRYRVFDWFQLPFTSSEWNGFLFNAGQHVKPVVAAGLGVDLSPYDHFALVIDKSDASLAAVAPDGIHVHVGAQSITPALLAHELGHFFGAPHANLETPTGVSEYDDRFCIMGREGGKFSFLYEPLITLDAAGGSTIGHAASGPGMAASILRICGWLNQDEHGIGIGTSSTSHVSQGLFELAPLEGAPFDPVEDRSVFAYSEGVAPHEQILIEYRVRSDIDRGLPDPGRWLVFHATERTGPRSSLQIGFLPALPGAVMQLPRAGYSITVLNATDQAVLLSRADTPFDGFVEVPAWLNLEEVFRGDDMGVIRPSAVQAALLADFQYTQREPGFGHEDVISSTPAAGTLVPHGSIVSVLINLEG